MARMDDAERVIWELNQTILRLEAERDHLKTLCTQVQESNGRAWERVQAAEARLAAAIDRLEMFKRVGSMDPVTVDGLTAILRGEGDRPAGHRCTAESMSDPESDCWSDPSE